MLRSRGRKERTDGSEPLKQTEDPDPSRSWGASEERRAGRCQELKDGEGTERQREGVTGLGAG